MLRQSAFIGRIELAGLLALRSDGIFSFMKQNGTRAVVDCDVPYATAANKLRREGGVDTSWYWSGQGGQPGWLWGGNDGTNMYVYNPANFSVNYANSAYISTAVSGVWFGRNNQTVPSGGTWRVITSINGKVDFMTVAGGTSIPHDWWYAVRVA